MSTTEKFLNYDGLKTFKDNLVTVIDEGDSLSSELTVQLGAGETLGGYKTGDIISEDTPLETIIKKLLAKQIPPTYTAPSVSISNNSGDASGAYEYGTKVTPKLKATYTQNNGGSLTSIVIKQGTTEVATGTTSPLTYTGDEITLTGTVTFKAEATYSEGAIKKDNLGDDYAEGHIAAGSKTSSNYQYTVYRPGYFYGVLDTVDEEITSDVIRSGSHKNGAYKAETVGTKDAPMIKASDVANRKRIFIACPADKTGVKQVTMPSAMGADCTGNFEKQDSTVTVEGANGTTGIAYNVWVYQPATISDDQTFVVTFG